MQADCSSYGSSQDLAFDTSQQCCFHNVDRMKDLDGVHHVIRINEVRCHCRFAPHY